MLRNQTPTPDSGNHQLHQPSPSIQFAVDRDGIKQQTRRNKRKGKGLWRKGYHGGAHALGALHPHLALSPAGWVGLGREAAAERRERRERPGGLVGLRSRLVAKFKILKKIPALI